MSRKLEIVLKNQGQKDFALRTLNDCPADGRVEVIFKEYASSRSKAQNNLYQAWCRDIGIHLNMHQEEVKTRFRFKFLEFAPLKKPMVIFGHSFDAWPPSTADLNVKEFNDYLVQIEKFCAENNIILPSNNFYEDAKILVDN